jgi:hypothetical protein
MFCGFAVAYLLTMMTTHDVTMADDDLVLSPVTKNNRKQTHLLMSRPSAKLNELLQDQRAAPRCVGCLVEIGHQDAH